MCVPQQASKHRLFHLGDMRPTPDIRVISRGGRVCAATRRCALAGSWVFSIRCAVPRKIGVPRVPRETRAISRSAAGATCTSPGAGLAPSFRVIPTDECDACEGCVAVLTNGRRGDLSDVLLERAFGEFAEMPGLQLTLRQARRLWGLEEPTCIRILDCLVDCGFLCRTASGYARAADGRMPCPRARNHEGA